MAVNVWDVSYRRTGNGTSHLTSRFKFASGTTEISFLTMEELDRGALTSLGKAKSIQMTLYNSKNVELLAVLLEGPHKVKQFMQGWEAEQEINNGQLQVRTFTVGFATLGS